MFSAALLAVSSFDSGSARAQDTISVPRTYKVQVQYHFFDTDYYYWSTVLETSNQSEAQMLYDILVWAKENNRLNQFAPHSYWRYLAVDVRMRVEYDWNFLQPQQYSLSPIRF